MSGSRTVPVVIVNTDHTFPWRVGAGLLCLLLASLFRRTLPTWAHRVLLALGAVLILGGFLW